MLRYFAKAFPGENPYIRYNLFDEKYLSTYYRKSEIYEVDYPMSWVISDYQLNRMGVALQRELKKNRSKFRFMQP